MQVQSLGWEDALEKEMATRSSILSWKSPLAKEPGGIQSMGSQKSQTQLSAQATPLPRDKVLRWDLPQANPTRNYQENCIQVFNSFIFFPKEHKADTAYQFWKWNIMSNLCLPPHLFKEYQLVTFHSVENVLLNSCSVVSDPLRPRGLQSTRLLCSWIFQARILEWVAISSSKGNFLAQGSNPGLLRLLHWQAYSLLLHKLIHSFHLLSRVRLSAIP